ncbi:MAG: response regulator, partial [Hyphomicrobium sp.]
FDCQILEAADGAEAWRLTRDHTIDVAIVDFDMPGLDGIALIRCLRSHPLTRHIPIIMCTSRCERSAMQAALEAGASSFMNKPVNWSMFATHIGHLISLSRAEAENSNALQRLEQTLAANDVHVAALLDDLRRFLRPDQQPAPAKAGEAAAAMQSRLARFSADYIAKSAPSGDLQRQPALQDQPSQRRA